MKFHSTVLFVKNIEKSKEFYTRFLGLSIEHDFGKNVILSSGLTLWEIQSEHLISQKLNTKVDSNKFELCFEDADIENIFYKLKDADVKFLHEIKTEPWGQRTCRFYDPDGHLIEIGEPLEVFVNNMSKNGLNESQISQNTGIPLETVKNIIKT